MSAIDELFSGVAEEQKSGSEIVREQTGHVSDNNIACAEKQFTHLFAFVIDAPAYSRKFEIIKDVIHLNILFVLFMLNIIDAYKDTYF
jgi:hypothetical protein